MPGSYGTVNDKTMVKRDKDVKKIRTNPLFTEYSYEVRDEDRNRLMTKGA